MEVKNEKIEKLKKGQKTAFIATFVTFLLAVTKGVAGYFFGSEILIADAFHSGADLLAIFASGFGLWLASKEKSVKFPYGLFKAETLVTFAIGILIIWVGLEILKEGYHKLFYQEEVRVFPLMPIVASVISIVAAFFIAKKEKSVGSAINSQSLLANAQESYLDIFTSAVVLIGIFLTFLQIRYIEGVVIILISILILKLGAENAWTSLLVLLDANLDPELQAGVENEINKIYGVKGTSEVKIRQSGPFKMIECEIQISPTLPLYRAHELADKAEKSIMKSYGSIESVFIHLKPSRQKTVSAIIPVKDINGMESRIHGHFGRAPYYIILKLTDTDTEIEDFYYNEFLHEKKHIGIKVIKAVIKYKLDLLFTSRIGELSFYMLKDNFVDIYKAEENTSVKDIVEGYRKNKIDKIISPTHPLEESQSADV